MGTKNNPGKFDCYENAAPNEPMFVLLGRDRHAALLVKLWALLRIRDGEDPAVVQEALACAHQMDIWFGTKRGENPLDNSSVAEDLFMAATSGMPDHPADWDDEACDCNECRAAA